jgi:restriction system protein
MDIVFHYPPELTNLLIDTISVLCRGKKDVLLFFKGAGIEAVLMRDLTRQVNQDRESIKKAEIVRKVLDRLNSKGEVTLRERREVLKRVVEFENFSACWPSDQLKAKGLVAEVRQLIDAKDYITRIRMEREEDQRQHRADREKRLAVEAQKRAELQRVKEELFALFKEQNPHRRGKASEAVLNRLFRAASILVQESFCLTGGEGEGITEQIDGIVELDGHLYFVEMKWWNKPLGPGEVSQHIVRVLGRGHARGIFISASEYTPAAIKTCADAFSQVMTVLVNLHEIVHVLEIEYDFRKYLKEKINGVIRDKNPSYTPPM